MPPAAHGNMFSTATSTPCFCSVARTASVNVRAYLPCQRKGGCTTTVGAPTETASSAERSSFTNGSLPHTNVVSSTTGAWIAMIGCW